MSFGQSGDFGHYDSTIIGENQMQYISADTSYQLSSMVMEGRDFLLVLQIQYMDIWSH